MEERKIEGTQKAELVARVKEVGGEGSRVLEFIASTETPDRSNDIIDVAGWNIDNYMGLMGKGANPVFAWSHDYTKAPLGKAVSVTKDVRAKTLRIAVKFPTIAELCSDPNHPSEEALFADTVYNMYKGGYLNAVSVGFNPIKYKTRDDPEVLERPEWQRGMHFLSAELLELSAVLVPCNPDALVSMRGMKSFNPAGIKMIEDIIANNGEEEDMSEERIKSLEDRLAKLESERALAAKSGAKFSKESKEAIAKVAEALAACHKGVKACHGELMKMIEDAADKESSGTEGQDGGSSDGREVQKPNADGKAALVEAAKSIDFATASLADAANLFSEEAING